MPRDYKDFIVLGYGERKVRLQYFTDPYNAFLFTDLQNEANSQDFSSVELALRAWADNCLEFESWDSGRD